MPPKSYAGIMISSSFRDLEKHRELAIQTVEEHGFKANAMEFSGANVTDDVIGTSLKLVEESAVYVGVIGRRYGQTPECGTRNKDCLSITELEFKLARDLNLPILLFVMDEKHPVTEADIELDPEKRKKLEAFREDAKKWKSGGGPERVYQVFKSVEEFGRAVSTAIGRLPATLKAPEFSPVVPVAPASSIPQPSNALLPNPPALRAVPKFIPAAKFIGRKPELETLNDWCRESDTDPVLLFQALGGMGKSMLTWEWLNGEATKQREWAGRFWYSFYERGATMEGFVRHALAYMRGLELHDLKDVSQDEALAALTAELDAKPWLLVLDGLERVLVAYNRIDADKMSDADAEAATDQMADRQPRRTYRPGDEDVLRALTAARASKILISTRLTPWALKNDKIGVHRGVRERPLGGLSREDAEALFRARGVKGDGEAIRDYLQKHCANHPLTIGALAGLVKAYPNDRGNFDQWVDDANHGRSLNFAGLDLTQKQTHILDTAVGALSSDARTVLQMMALVSGGLDYKLLTELNPLSPPEPDKVEEPINPETQSWWGGQDDDEKAADKTRFANASAEYQAYLTAHGAWEASPERKAAPGKLDRAIRELEERGLIQYDETGSNFDLHPVVRRVADGKLSEDEVDAHGRRIVDIFNARPHASYDEAETWADVAPGVEIMRAQLRMGRFDDALGTFRGAMQNALSFNLGAEHEILELIRPFFLMGWEGEIAVTSDDDRSYLLNCAASALERIDGSLAKKLHGKKIVMNIRLGDALRAGIGVANRATFSTALGRLAQSERLRGVSLRLAQAARADEQIFRARFDLFVSLCRRGDSGAETMYQELAASKTPAYRARYREGELEDWRASHLFWTGRLTDAELTNAESAARRGRDLSAITNVLRTRARWQLSRGEPAHAIAPLNECIQRERQARQNANWDEAMLALAQYCHRKDAVAARSEAERLTEAKHFSLELAELWHELGERNRAVEIALKHHEGALADGEPYVFRYELDKTREFLTKLGEPLPPLRQHDPSKDEIFPWEKDVEELIKKLEAENEEKDKKKPQS